MGANRLRGRKGLAQAIRQELWGKAPSAVAAAGERRPWAGASHAEPHGPRNMSAPPSPGTWPERSQRISATYQTLARTLTNDLEIVVLRLLRERADPGELREAVEGQLRLRRAVQRGVNRHKAMRDTLYLIEEAEEAQGPRGR